MHENDSNRTHGRLQHLKGFSVGNALEVPPIDGSKEHVEMQLSVRFVLVVVTLRRGWGIIISRETRHDAFVVLVGALTDTET
jgi:cytochrome b